MRVTFVLKKILEAHNGCRRGAIKHICNNTKLERHYVSDLLNNRVKAISTEVLYEICKYLHTYHGIDRQQLPGCLFEFEAAGFWSLLADCDVEVCFGVRAMKERTEPRWVNAYDSYLQGVLLRELFSMGHDKLSDLKQHLVRSVSPEIGIEETKQETKELHDEFHAGSGNRALVCLGSVKSNPVSERVIAGLFECQPFETKEVYSPRERRCPIFFEYRRNDPQAKSCHGGLHLTSRRKKSRPGIYYETADGKWEYLPVSDREDAAMVLYAYRPNQGVTEMIMAGFSGRSTGCIALGFPRLADELWPPHYARDDLKLGVFLLRFAFDKESPQRPRGPRTLVEPSSHEVIPLDKEVLQRRLNPTV